MEIIDNAWFISIVASLASVGIITIISILYKKMKEKNNLHSGHYLIVSEGTAINTFIAEVISIKVFHGDIQGKIKSLFLIDTKNSRYKYKDLHSVFKVTGKIKERAIIISYVSLNKEEHDVGTFAMQIDNSGTLCTGIWSNIISNKVSSYTSIWTKITKNQFNNRKNQDLKKNIKRLITLSFSNKTTNSVAQQKVLLELSNQGYRSLLNFVSTVLSDKLNDNKYEETNNLP